MRVAPARVLLGVGGAVAVAAGALYWGARTGQPMAADLRVPELEDAETADAVFAVARDVLAGGEGVSALLNGIPPYHSALCAYDVKPRRPPRCTAGRGESLGEAVRSAARSLSALPDAPNAVLKWDAVVHARHADWPGEVAPIALGVDGWWVQGAGREILVPPSRGVEAGWFPGPMGAAPRWDASGLEEEVRAALGVPPGETSLQLVRTVAWVEGSAGPTRLARMHPADVPPITPETVLERAVWASDHLLAATFGPT
ncbi:MAG: hypothetical protein ACI9K2_003159, partial [Myxococcota bacterium]